MQAFQILQFSQYLDALIRRTGVPSAKFLESCQLGDSGHPVIVEFQRTCDRELFKVQQFDQVNKPCTDAIRCYGANVYLACCAMCGAAAESILLAIAVAKEGDADKVERLYLASSGRKKVENLVLGQQVKPIQEEFLGYMSLLKYWRDAASHGRLRDFR